MLYWRHLPARFLHNDFGSDEITDTTGSGLSVASLVTIVKVVSDTGVPTGGGGMGSSVAFSSFPKCKF